MKFIIIGLGVFGSSLATKLAEMGHEVIGVDKQLDKVEDVKDKITYAMCLDCKHQDAVNSLPLKNTDVVVVAIGEDEGANLLTTALMKKHNVARLVSRSLSNIHETILESMGITEIARPEEETAERWARKLTTNGIVDSFRLTKDFSIIEAAVPERFIGKTIQEIGFNKEYTVIVLTIMKNKKERNIIGVYRKVARLEAHGIPTATTILEKDDILVLYGHNDNLNRLLQQ